MTEINVKNKLRKPLMHWIENA